MEESKNEKLTRIASKVLELLTTEFGEEPDNIDLSDVLAHTLVQHQGPSPKLMSLALNHTVARYVALRLASYFPTYQSIYATLVARGAIGAENAFDAGGDVYAYTLPDRHVPSEFGSPTVRLMVLTTQQMRFLIVFHNPWGDDVMHVRQFWDDAEAELAKPNNYVPYLEPYRNAKNLSVQDVLKLSAVAENYANDLPGAVHPDRLTLKSILAGSLAVGSASAGRALALGDAWDAGYVWSFDSGRPRFNMMDSDYHMADHVSMRLAMVAESLEISMPS